MSKTVALYDIERERWWHPDLLPEGERIAAHVRTYHTIYMPIGVVKDGWFYTESDSKFPAYQIDGWIYPPATETD